MKGLSKLNSSLINGYSLRKEKQENGQKVFNVLQGQYIKESFNTKNEALRYLNINDIIPQKISHSNKCGQIRVENY